MNDDVLVLGAGPAGLAFAQRYGDGAVVLEKGGEPGGLSRSIEIDDGVFDLGGHSFHTPHAEVSALVREVLGDNWFQQQRDARVWTGAGMIPYPFQHHFDKLADPAVVQACSGHVHDQVEVAASAHFEDWILRRFGRGVAQHFMLPYNRKLWACDLRDLCCDWVGQRVATERAPAPEGADGAPQRTPLLADSEIAYPRDGGFGAIFSALARRCPRIEFNRPVVRIDPVARLAWTADGQTWPWRTIVSTMPLPDLLDRIVGCPERMRGLAARLKAVSLKILMILVKAPSTPVPQRVYIADPVVPPHKVAFNHTSSPSLGGRAKHAIMCEVSYSAMKPAPADGALLDSTVAWLEGCSLIGGAEDVVETRVVDLPLGYPVNTHDKAAVVAEIRGWLESLRIHTIGRFGAWDYANSDECMRQGLVLADALRGDPG